MLCSYVYVTAGNEMAKKRKEVFHAGAPSICRWRELEVHEDEPLSNTNPGISFGKIYSSRGSKNRLNYSK